MVPTHWCSRSRSLREAGVRATGPRVQARCLSVCRDHFVVNRLVQDTWGWSREESGSNYLLLLYYCM